MGREQGADVGVEDGEKDVPSLRVLETYLEGCGEPPSVWWPALTLPVDLLNSPDPCLGRGSQGAFLFRPHL